jgi:hypothetical protein
VVARGFTEDGQRVLLAVMLGMRESHEDWLALARDLIACVLGGSECGTTAKAAGYRAQHRYAAGGSLDV